jgi:hypothetical protein
VQSRVSRVARGWIAGSFATGVAAVGHGLAGGSAPSTLAILVGLVFAGLLGTLAVGRRPSLPRLTVVVAGSQVAFHLVFSWLTPGTAGPAAHHEMSTLLEPAVAPAVDPAVVHHGTDPWMWAAHAVALFATIVFLRRAELALWNLLRDAFRVTATLPVAIAARPSTDRTITPESPRHPISFIFFSVLSHRGPPATRFAL